MTRGFVLVVVGWLLAAALSDPARAVGGTLRITPLVRDGQVLVSFELVAGVSPATWETIRSGLPTTLTYDVELRRGVSLWLDRTLHQASVGATVHYDNLTRRYQLTRSIDGRVEAAVVTEADDEARRWLAAFDRLSLFGAAELEPNGEYYVRVRVRTHPRSTWSLWPWGGGDWDYARFTFLP